MTVCNMSHRVGRQGRPDRARPDDVRLPRGPPAGAEGRRLGRRRRALEDAAHRRRRRVRRGDRPRRRRTMTPFVTWGTNPGQGVPLGAAVPSPDDFDDADRPDRRREGAASTWASRPARRCATSRSTPSSSAPAPTAGSRTCAPPRRSSRGRTGRRRTPGCWSCPARSGCGCRPRPRVSTRSSRRPAPSGAGAGCSMCLGMNPDQLAPGERSASTSNRNFEGRQGKGGRTHLVSVAGRRRHRGPRHAVRPRPTCERALSRHGEVHQPHRHRRPAAPQQRRHRPDHPGGLPQAGHPHRLRGRAVRGLAQRPGRSCSTSPAYAARLGARRRPRLRHRLARASTPSGRCRTTASRP